MRREWLLIIVCIITTAWGLWSVHNTLAQPAGDFTPPPGATNPDVTQDTIGTTVCQPGYTHTIRPPVEYTDNLKYTQMRERNYSDTNPADYEEDHWVALAIGGNPVNATNLWPEPYNDWGPAGRAREKDRLEYAMYRALCAHAVTLAEAQGCFLNQPRWDVCLNDPKIADRIKPFLSTRMGE